jgi:hypothetical protein
MALKQARGEKVARSPESEVSKAGDMEFPVSVKKSLKPDQLADFMCRVVACCLIGILALCGIIVMFKAVQKLLRIQQQKKQVQKTARVGGAHKKHLRKTPSFNLIQRTAISVFS